MEQNTKKKGGCLKGCLIAVIAVFAFFILIMLIPGGDDKESTTEATTKTTETTTAVTTEATTEAVEPTTEKKSSSDKPDPETIESLIESALNSSLEAYDHTIDVDKDCNCTLNITVDGMSEAVKTISANPDNTEVQEIYNNFISTYKDLSSTGYDLLKTLNCDDSYFMINILNDLNPDNVLFSFANGSVLYDATK